MPDRKLHGGLGFERMFDVFTYEGLERDAVKERYFLKPEVLEEGRELLVGDRITDKFRLERMDVQGEKQFAAKNYGIVLVIDGCGEINGWKACRGDRFFLPVSETELICKSEKGMTFLACFAF